MKRKLLFLRDVFELYIPILAFIGLFGSFVIQVFTRYVLNNPLTWTSDLIVLSFSWLVILGSCYAMRKKKQVQFTMLYDMYPPKVAALFRLVGNIIIIVTFSLMIIPSLKFSIFQKFQKTASLRINLFWEFIPYVYFLISIICYSIPPCIEDIKVLAGKIPDSEDHIKDRETMPSLNKITEEV